MRYDKSLFKILDRVHCAAAPAHLSVFEEPIKYLVCEDFLL